MSQGNHERDLAQRVAVLEATVDDLQRALATVRSELRNALPPAHEPTPHVIVHEQFDLPATAAALTHPSADSLPPPPATRPPIATVKSGLSNEDWLSRIGIGLLLVGLAFLFKLSIARGWVTPPMRLLFGSGLGVGLLAAGFRLRQRQPALGRILMGGSVATFYVTVFAAFQLYALIDHTTAVAAMFVVTAIGFGLAAQQRDGSLAIVATLGGLGAPFVLHGGGQSLDGLVTYIGLVIACATGMFLYGGWRRLLAVIAVGGGSVLLIPWWQVVVKHDGGIGLGAVQAGLLVCLVAIGVVPIARLLWLGRRDADIVDVGPEVFFAATAPIITFALSAALWGWTASTGAMVGIGGAVAYVVVSIAFRRTDWSVLAAATDTGAAVLLALGMLYGADNPRLDYALFGLEGAALLVIARVYTSPSLRPLGHTALFVVGIILAWHVLTGRTDAPAVLGFESLVDALAIASLAVAGWALRGHEAARWYVVFAYIAALAWCRRELVHVDNGHALVSAAWGVSALTILAYGWRHRVEWLRRLGLVALVAVVLKLFIVDLAELDALWRVALFLGFGGVLLVLSYAMPRLFDADPQT